MERPGGPRCRLYRTEDGYARAADQRADAVFVASSHTSDHAIQADRIVGCNGWRRGVCATGAAQVPLEGIDDGGKPVGELRAGKRDFSTIYSYLYLER